MYKPFIHLAYINWTNMCASYCTGEYTIHTTEPLSKLLFVLVLDSKLLKKGSGSNSSLRLPWKCSWCSRTVSTMNCEGQRPYLPSLPLCPQHTEQCAAHG